MNNTLNPWSHIWIHPRETLRSILQRNPRRLIIWLAILASILSFFASEAMAGTGKMFESSQSALAFTAAAIIIGALIGLFHLYFGGWLLRLTGGWLGGQGNFTEVKCAIGWANYPAIVFNIAFLFKAALWSVPPLAMIFALIGGVLWVWNLVIYVFLIAEAHKFSAWRSLGAILLAAVLIFAVLVIIGLLVPLLGPLWG